MSLLTRTLGEICEEVNGIIQTGPFGSQLHESDYRDTGTPVIMPKDMVEGKVSVESIARIGDDDVARLARHKLEKGDIVYGRRGDIGRHALVTEHEAGWLCGTGCLRISLGTSVVYPQFLHYYLGQDHVVAWVYNQAVGATLPNLNTNIVRSIPVTYPPLPSQRKIAAILSAYDDLIENNRRRIAILEEMARLVYREWFVEFRFPGHEGVGRVESELGPIPAGWEAAELGEIAREVRRGVRPEQLRPETPYFGLEHLPRRSIALSDWGTAEDIKSNKLAFRKGEILFGKIRPYFHKVGVAPVDGICSTDAIVIVPTRPEYFSLALCCVSSDAFVTYATATSQGTKMPRADWHLLVKYPVALPPAPILATFDQLIRQAVDLIENLVLRNRNLTSTRDLLLPRLISGEIDVSELPIETGGLDA